MRTTDCGTPYPDKPYAAPVHSHGSPSGTLPDSSPSTPDLLLTLFAGREDVHALQSAHRGRTLFTPCAGALDVATAAAHLAGAKTVAIYLQQIDGRVRTAVIDIDAVDSPKDDSTVEEFARNLRRVCAELGIPANIEDSGRRGRHLWLFFDSPVHASLARRLARLLAARAGHPRPGVRVEVLPRHTEWPGPELGDAVKLPLGVHPLTGRRCWLLNGQNEPIPDPIEALDSLRQVPTERIPTLLESLSAPAAPAAATAPSTDGRVAVLYQRCSVVRALAERARASGHLRHTHRLMLLYTLGRLEANGAAELHRLMALCENYRPEMTDGYLARLEPEHPPLSCRRIREWLEEEGEQALCICPVERRSPVEFIESEAESTRRKPRRAAASPPEQEQVDSALWGEISQDLFQEEPDGKRFGQEDEQ